MTALDTVIANTLDDAKAQNITQLDVTHLTNIADTMFICTATSTRHAQSLARKVKETVLEQCELKALNAAEPGAQEWILIDFGDSLVHIMQEESRELYALEKLWSVAEEARANDG